MISKIIQKEKDRQKEILESIHNGIRAYDKVWIEFHKQSLINLKEYLEEELEYWRPVFQKHNYIHAPRFTQLKEDIKELNKMIEKYG